MRGYVLLKDNEVFILIRGTSNFSEWMDDFDAVQIDYPYARQSFFPWRRIKVHRGFMDSYRSVRDGLLRGVRMLEVNTVYVLGHSLGAAITTLCALDISKFQNEVMYNYASPFVGNERFSSTILHLSSGATVFKMTRTLFLKFLLRSWVTSI